MMNLVIGITIGIACAIALGVMWRMAERLRQELQSGKDQAGGTPPPARKPADWLHRNN